jgi:hypothetical protein
MNLPRRIKKPDPAIKKIIEKSLFRNAHYINARNALVPKAVKFTNEMVGPNYLGKDLDKQKKWQKRWDWVFLRRMDELARKDGLLSC